MVLEQIKLFRKNFFHIVLLFYKSTASTLYNIPPLNGRADETLKSNPKIIPSQLLRIPSRRLGKLA